MRPLVALSALQLLLFGTNAIGDVTIDDSIQESHIVNSLLWQLFESQNGADPHINHVKFGHLTQDNNLDAIVLYSPPVGPGDGNFYVQRLAVFVNRNGSLQRVQDVQVGAKGKRFLTPTGISYGDIFFDVEFWQDSDPACCPSGKSTTQFQFIQGMLEEK